MTWECSDRSLASHGLLTASALAPTAPKRRPGRCSAAPSAQPGQHRRQGRARSGASRRASEKNVKWSAEAWRQRLGGPVVAGGRIFVGTNNDTPATRASRATRASSCASARRTASFSGRSSTTSCRQRRPAIRTSTASSRRPCVDGNRLYYVSNRCEVVCATWPATGTGKAKILWTLDMIKDLSVYPGGLTAASSICSPLDRGRSGLTSSPPTASISDTASRRTGCAQLHRRRQEDGQGGLEGAARPARTSWTVNGPTRLPPRSTAHSR